MDVLGHLVDPVKTANELSEALRRGGGSSTTHRAKLQAGFPSIKRPWIHRGLARRVALGPPGLPEDVRGLRTGKPVKLSFQKLDSAVRAAAVVTLMVGLIPAAAQSRRESPSGEGSAAGPSRPVEIKRVRIWSHLDYTRVVVDLEAVVRYKFDRLSDPERLYLDLFDTQISPELAARQIPVRDPYLNRIRVGQTQDGITRIVLDLNAEVSERVFVLTDPPRLVVDLKTPGGTGEVREATAKPAAASGVTPPNGAPKAETRPAEKPTELSPAASQPSPTRPIPAAAEAPEISGAKTEAGKASPHSDPTTSKFESTALADGALLPKGAPVSEPPPLVPVKLATRGRTLRIPRVSRPPKLEDFLAHAPREAEAVVTDFLQREPGDGIPASQKTRAYLSYDDKNLYVVFVCEDQSGRVRAHLAKREEIAEDDQVGVYVDAFHDGQHAYAFEANPLGLQRDGIVTEGQTTNYSFDTLWHSEGRLTEQGFIVWMAIPFKSLRFSNSSRQIWGITLGRTILRNNEISYWPLITRRVEGFVNQMATLEGLDHISPGHNVQFIPYSIFTGSRFLDSQIPAFRTDNEGRAGLDAKAVLRDALTLDVTANPDFSQVESDEPQVTVNQRFAVQFPEKRPFFLENAGFFQTPVNLFFSRRIIDPQFGMRLTGKVGRWALAGLFMDDRAEGKLLSDSDPLHRHRADIGVARLQREFGSQSNIGLLVTSRDFGASSNRVYSFDTRLKLSPNWVFTGQLMRSYTRNLDGTRVSGSGSLLELDHSGRHFVYSGSYSDLSPNFRSQLGFVPRVDVRQTVQFGSYTWRPKRQRVLSFGPSLSTLVNWDRRGRVQDWLVDAKFGIELPGQTTLGVGQFEAFELFQDLGFRKSATYASFYTAWLKWLAISASYSKGTDVNFFPAPGLAPFLAESASGSFTLTLRPTQRLRLDNVYIYTSLGTRNGSMPLRGPVSASIFNNHIARWKLNYQFTRALSFRAILDYFALLPNTSLVAARPTKTITGDILFTYLLNPGTALYVGCTDRYENLVLDSTLPPMLRITESRSTSTGRQCFIKASYLLRF